MPRKTKIGRRKYAREYHKKNRAHIYARQKRWYKANKARVDRWYANRHCQQKYGITIDEYNRLKKKAKGRCQLCKQKVKHLCLDHCHKTKKLRGFLCVPCNRYVIGIIEKRNISLRTIAKYLGVKL